MTNDDDAIVAFLVGDSEKLSKSQEERLERLYFCDDAIRKYSTKGKVINMLAIRYKVSKSTAERYYQSTQYVFGSSAKHNREYSVVILWEFILDSRRVAKITGNANAMAKCDKNLMDLIEKFMGDSETPDYANVQLPTQIFSADPELLGMGKVDDKKLRDELERLARNTKRRELSMGYTEDVEIIDDTD